MSSHRYQRVGLTLPFLTTNMPLVDSQKHLDSYPRKADQTLADTFGDDDEDSDAEDGVDDRQRLMRGNTSPQGNSVSTNFGSGGNGAQPQAVSAAGNVTQAAFNPPISTSSRTIRGAGTTNDGVFANLAAKPERGEKTEDLPPTYEQAAADATPPYWETTIVAPGMSSDEVYVDGLPQGRLRPHSRPIWLLHERQR
ncbi:metal homeostatis protein bsd2 [Histoplasma capsulatum H143]|uniref:Metal homeostatis protein bsd2 n=1 Tax=Ajellomyces capsulatus (strain H143) TaxID=544712 RepID=C6H6X7_AJECH|nr:metal homeostatis protein bsd2 [Histoplasma capsulatum H143]